MKIGHICLELDDGVRVNGWEGVRVNGWDGVRVNCWDSVRVNGWDGIPVNALGVLMLIDIVHQKMLKLQHVC